MQLILNGLAFATLLFLSRIAAAAPVPCPDLLFPDGQCPPDAGAAVAACCDCDGFPNHGQYVRCVAHSVTALRRAGCIDEQARQIKRCAARSTCGKPGFVTCCAERPGVCEDGVCAASNPPLACTTSVDCPPVTTCRITRDAETCTGRAGTPGAASSCCNACGP